MNMPQISFFPLSWKQFQADTFQLAQKVIASGEKFDRIIAISRGGLVTARMLSDFLDLQISVFSLVSYQAIGQPSHPRVVEELSITIKDERILLVDEIADTGKSFIVGVKYLQDFQPKKIMTLALYIKPKTSFKPDYWQVSTQDWVIFPYEVKETIKDVTALLQDQGWTQVQISEKIATFGFADDQLESFSL